jgi:hypothetical protein
MTQEAPKHRPWTLMVYMAGDNGKVFDTKFGKKKLMAEMTSAGYQDIWEMAQVGTTDAAAVVCLFDTQTDSYLVEVRKGNGMDGSAVETLPEVNTGSPDALADFVVQAMQKYPADHYALVIWNHGTGWLDIDYYAPVRSTDPDVRATNAIFRTTPRKIEPDTTRPIAYDDSSKDFLDTADLRQVFNTVEAKTGRKLDIIGMDACLMAAVEGARELAPHASYFLASQEVEPMDGWPYQPILTSLNADAGMTPADLTQKIVGEFAKSYQAQTRAEETVTQSAVSLACTGRIESLCKTLVDAILAKRDQAVLKSLVNQARGKALVFQDPHYRDLGDFALQLANLTEWESYPEVTAAAKAIYGELESRGAEGPIMVVAYRPKYKGATGMSVYLPQAGRPADKRAKELAIYRNLFFSQATGWPDLLEWLDADF